MIGDPLKPDSPCEVTVTPLDNGGVDVKVFVPTFSGGGYLSITVERDAEGDWLAFIPWPDDLDENRSYHINEHWCDAANGVAYIGAPDLERERTA